ncbi:MAG: hypothetical protein ABF289_16340, partial [Clostridiales bacterium]
MRGEFLQFYCLINLVISFYKQGEFVDLCAGPHIMTTGQVKAMKNLSFA